MKQKKLKILMVHPHDLYSASEPWTIRITFIAQELVKLGHKVKIVYFPLQPSERGKTLKKKHTEFETIPFKRSKWHLPYNIGRMYKLSKWADIIHFQKCFPIASLPALFAAYLRNKPVHYDWDDWEYAIYNWDPPSKIYGQYINFMEQTIPKLADTVSVASNHLRKLALKAGVSKENIFDSHVGADLEKFHPKNKGDEIRLKYKIKCPFIIYLGQLHGGQYAELFLKAAKLVLKEYKNTKFMIVGGGHYLPTLKQKNHELGLDKEVIFVGYTKYDDVPKYLAAADICVAAFEDNNITKCKSPLKIVEYLAAGKAIVASDVGEVKRMLGDSGIAVKAGDEKAIAKGIIRFLTDKRFKKKSEKKARKRAEEEYNWQVTAKNLEKAYKTIVKFK
ncbi:MAG: glycosyltransferase family 4 protein [Nanoarchaeota archaeon]|nr:glycosyltransferase family 4 protein [Nanoarchaeota archaeon]MBU1030895.1 glycosyltransferase family 4 protein [Nanoarchaeota archaeon]